MNPGYDIRDVVQYINFTEDVVGLFASRELRSVLSTSAAIHLLYPPFAA